MWARWEEKDARPEAILDSQDFLIVSRECGHRQRTSMSRVSSARAPSLKKGSPSPRACPRHHDGRQIHMNQATPGYAFEQ